MVAMNHMPSAKNQCSIEEANENKEEENERGSAKCLAHVTAAESKRSRQIELLKLRRVKGRSSAAINSQPTAMNRPR